MCSCPGRAAGAVTAYVRLLLQHQRQGVDSQGSQALPTQGKLWPPEAVPQPAQPAFTNQGDSTPGESASSQPPAAVAAQPGTAVLQGAEEALDITIALLGSTSQPEQLVDQRLATGQALGTAGEVLFCSCMAWQLPCNMKHKTVPCCQPDTSAMVSRPPTVLLSADIKVTSQAVPFGSCCNACWAARGGHV